MLTVAALLAAVAVALAWPVPVLLAGARWPSRSPGTALALWQAIALCGGFSMIGSLLAFGLIPFGDSLPQAADDLGAVVLNGPLPPGTGLIHAFALSGAVLLTAHLVANLVVTAYRTERQRRRHRDLVDLLSAPLPDRPGTRVIDHPAPVAYCLPGARTVTVLSEGLVSLLDSDQLEAVVQHERAHLRQQHHLVLVAFASWRNALPWFPIATRAHDAVALLVEMLADDQARAALDDRTVARAIALVGAAEDDGISDRGVSAGSAPTSEDHLSRRTERLLSPWRPLPRAARGGVLLVAALLPLVPLAALVLA